MNKNQFCRVSDTCGGCFYSDTESVIQQQLRVENVRNKFEKEKVEIPDNFEFYSGSPCFYRNRMDFAFSAKGLGLRERGSYYRIVNCETCSIANKEINEILHTINEWYRRVLSGIDIFDNYTKTGTFRYAVIRSSFFSKEASVTFILNKDSPRLNEQSILIEEFTLHCDVPNILLGQVKHNSDVSNTNNYKMIKGTDIIYENLGDYRYYYHTQGFFQNNSEMTLKMLHFIKDLIKEEYDILVDLFGGVGTFGIFLSDMVKEVIIVDNNTYNINCAFKNVEENKKENVKILQTDANNLMGLFINLGDKKQVFIIDPPRTGLQKETIKFFKWVKPEKIIYISCNTSQLIKDIKMLHNLYSIHRMALFDMFPQTNHIECIIELNVR